MVIFTCPPKHGARRIARISCAFDERLRSTDRAGFLATDQFAVLLPDTAFDGAKKVANDLAETFCDLGLPQPPNVFVYPEDSLPTTEEDDDNDESDSGDSVDHLFLQPLPLWKRCLNVLGSSTALLLALPVMAVAAIAIKLTSPGPVLFRQQRAGLGGRRFTIYKFRTMRVDAEEMKATLRKHSEQDGPAFKIKDDPRITPVGKYLRRTCLDEFPQFWNVLRGDMSLVGPRPLPCEESEKCEPWQRRRLMVTPGLTCTWQVSGGMRIPFVEWMRMDIRYIRSQRLVNDVRLLWRTLLAVLLHRASH